MLQTQIRANLVQLQSIGFEEADAIEFALDNRLDLMNQRGFLADDWRLIKYAGDDLRSILNINASQSIRTRSVRHRAQKPRSVSGYSLYRHGVSPEKARMAFNGTL